jgi:tetratricopeptide (TPR) repeat protein
MKPDAAKLYNSGNKMLKQGNYQDAIKDYDQALAIDKDFRAYYQRGVAYKMSGNLDSAEASFQSCIKAKPDFDFAYNALGGVYFSKGKYQDAADNFEKILTISKNKAVIAKVKSNLSLVYAKMGNQEEAAGNVKKGVEYYQKAVANSDYDAAYLALAKAYSDLGQYDKTMEAAQDAMKYRKTIGKGGPYYYMGVAYKNQGDKAKAKEMFDKAKSDPTYKKLAEYELTALK